MRYRILGNTGLRVSVIGLGTWQFGGEWGRAFSQADADAILDQAGALGINLLDTAECYGDHLSESLVGDYLSRHDRSRWIVATKFGHRFQRFMTRAEDFSPAGVRQQLEASLRALRLEAIDLYQFHSGSDSQLLNDDLWAMLAEQKQAGKIRHLGISIPGKGSEPQAREARRLGAETLQVIYNRLDRRPEQLYFPHAQRDHLGILARVPLASGLLSGKYRADAAFPAQDWRSTLDADKLRRDLAEVERIRQSELPAGMAMAQWALAWCLQHPAVSTVIPGCMNPAQVAANAAAAELELPR
ncbi:MAG TPA: aldo/keto reductase [Verrucomicrobiota bacterium]|jgi:aryl-alcohol dehydrogenase-like predicted oxidoreductase|nr:aldo/keto reductase [Verrucomicrobiota bacterium]HNZ75864.1 aldo/keto reductase [Verrucomicrobiota bacterium]HOH39649.1 aldo/keto reductase [Verrucomicrobiota bacterium]HOX63040.1 aldo/keto reductase [Verrucomicrobiota bacterium]HPI65156.1 aldo/keto reductase [Verrucomicrobiota bacterium]